MKNAKMIKFIMKNAKIMKLIMAVSIILIVVVCVNNPAKATDKDGDIVVVLDPGHGGAQPGAVNAKLGLVQKDLNLKVARYAEQELQKYAGIKVYLTHNGLASNVDLGLVERADIAKKYNADMLVSLHFNASTYGRQGAEVFVPYKEKYYAESKILGEMVLKRLASLGINNGGVKVRLSENNTRYPDGSLADYYAIIKNAYLNNIPCVLIEHCFLDSADTRFINSEEKVKAMGKADADAIVEYYGLKEQLFPDIAYHWARDRILKMAEYGYVSGHNNRFHPNNRITRAEFVAIVCNIFGYEEGNENPFSDVRTTDWYYKAVLTSYNTGIAEGHNGRFNPNKNITRQEACVILTKLFELAPTDMSAADRFNDQQNISDWARDSVIAMLSNGIMAGTDKNELLPKGNLTRAEAAVMLEKAIF